MTQTALHLRIINLTSLPDGGPLEVSVAPGGMLEAGRDSGLDWCLPDPQRLISSRHFEIRSEKGGWVLYDLSTNGTFLNGATTRVKSPSPLHDGDRLQVGQYSIEIRCEAVAAPAFLDPAPERPSARSLPGGLDPWSMQAAPSTAPPAAPQPVSHSFPPAAPPGAMPAPEGPSVAGSAGGAGDIWSLPGSGSGTASAPPTGPAPVPSWPIPSAPQTTDPPAPVGSEPAGGAPALGQPAPTMQNTAPPGGMPDPSGYAQGSGTDAGFAAPPPAGPQDAALLEIIEGAAGLASGTLSRGDAQTAAREIGETLRALTEELSGLLQARAVARRSVRSAQVTMIGREDNNPLKFMPTPDQALGIMFGPPRPGFQRGPAAVRAGFADIKTHQYATHAALQPALAQLLEDLTPEAIEKRLEGVRLNRKSRAWEMYVERWDAKTRPHENGLLDVFLALFAEAYDRESGRKD